MADVFTIPNELSTELGRVMKNALVDQLRASGKVSTGKLINSLQINVVPGIDGPVIELAGNSYYAVIEDGRKPGKYAPISPLKQWIKAKGIESDEGKITARAYAISNSIKRKGIKATPLTDNTFNQSLPLFDRIIDDVMGRELDNYLTQQYAKIK